MESYYVYLTLDITQLLLNNITFTAHGSMMKCLQLQPNAVLQVMHYVNVLEVFWKLWNFSDCM